MPRLTKPVVSGALAEPHVFALDGFPCAMEWSARGDILAIGDDAGVVTLIDPGSGAIRSTFHAHEGPVQALAWNPSRDALLTTGQDGRARQWEAPFELATDLLADVTGWVDHACWSPSGDRAAFSVATHAHIITATQHVISEATASTIEALAFTPSGKSLGVACYGGVQLFDPTSGRPTRKLDWRGSMLSIAFSPDGSVVACGCQDNSVHFWRIASGRDAQMSGFPAKPRRVGFSHDGKWLATAGDTDVCLWPFDRKGPEGRRPVQLSGHAAIVTELAFAPLVNLLVSGARDGTVALWSPPKLTTPAKLVRLTGKITHVGWGADGAASRLRWSAADENGHVMIGEV